MKHLKTTKFEFSSDTPNNPATLRLAHISDFHLGKPSGDDLPRERALERWLEGFAGEGVDVLAVTGDLVEEPGDRGRLEDAKRMLDEAPFPYVCIPGNHDVPEPGAPGPFEELFGEFPRVERLLGLDLVLFDSMKGLPVHERSEKERQNASSVGFFSLGAVGRAQRDEVDARLSEPAGEPARFGQVLCVHHHLRKGVSTAPKGLMAPLEDTDALLEWATNHDIHLVLHGHKHDFWKPYEPRPGLVALNVGASASATKGRKRRGRLVDISEGMASIVVRDVELE